MATKRIGDAEKAYTERLTRKEQNLIPQRIDPPERSPYDAIRYDTTCHFKVQSKADTSRLNLPHGTNN